MIRASITDAKNAFSALLDKVRQGATVVIEDRGVPVARLEPVLASGSGKIEGRLARLERQGVVRTPESPTPRTLLSSAPPRPRRTATLSEAVLAERREGR